MSEATAVPGAPHGVRRSLDERAVERTLRRLAAAPSPPWLHVEVARRMAERLPLILRTPGRVMQWWAWLGAGDALLAQAYPKARRWLVEPTPALGRRAAAMVASPWWSTRRWSAPQATVIAEADVTPRSADLLWANMMLHAVADPPALLARWKRALADDGFVMFSTLGPGTLTELHAIYRQLGWPSPAAPWVDMHDIGDMLVHAGFADPVMDQERIVLAWRDADALIDELRSLGANVDPQRFAGLRTPRWGARLRRALDERRDPQGRIAMGFEVVYGHAFNAAPRIPVAARTEVAAEDLRAMARQSRRSKPGDV